MMSSNDAEEPTDDGSDQSETVSPPSYAVAMQEAIEADVARQNEARQVAFAVNVTEGHRQSWADAWETFGPSLIAYLNGEPAQLMVEALQVLDSAIESVGFDSSLKALNAADSFPKYDNRQDQIDAAVCRLVTGVWADIRFNGKNQETIVAELDAVAARVPTEQVSFVQCVIEAGGFPNCPDCNERLAPSEVGRGRCDVCIHRDRLTLRRLAIAIECEHRYGNKVYGDGFNTHFPEWVKWRRRLRECYGRDRSDWQLWEDWIGYAQEHRGIDQQQFLNTLRNDAESLLPPLRDVEKEVVADEACGSNADEEIIDRKRIEARPAGSNAEQATEVPKPVSDDDLPRSKRADSPSRVKASAAYEYAMERIPNANAMTGPELFDAINSDGEAAAMLPPTATSFVTYLNDCGIKLRKGGPKAPGSSVVRQCDK